MTDATPDLPTWQREHYERFLDTLGVIADDLTHDEQRFLVWLAGWDQWTADGFLSVIRRLH